MPSEYDMLVEELRVGQAVTSLPPDRRRWLEHQLAALEPASPMAKAAPALPDDDTDAFFELAKRPQVRSTEDLGPKLRELTKSAQVGLAQVNAIRRTQARERARDTARAALAKALELVHAGRMTAHEASVIEARANHIFAKAGDQ